MISNAEEIGKDIDGKEILSDKDINKIAEVIDDIDSPSKEFLTKAKEEAAKDHEGEESKANIVINPVTGNPMLVHDITEDKDDNLQSFEEMLVDDSIKPQDIKIEDVAKVGFIIAIISVVFITALVLFVLSCYIKDIYHIRKELMIIEAARKMPIE